MGVKRHERCCIVAGLINKVSGLFQVDHLGFVAQNVVNEPRMLPPYSSAPSCPPRRKGVFVEVRSSASKLRRGGIHEKDSRGEPTQLFRTIIGNWLQNQRL